MDTQTELKWKCPRCGHTIIEEMLSDVVVSTPLRMYVEDGPEPTYDYNREEHHGGVLDHYQCATCGYVLEGIESQEELYEFLLGWNRVQEVPDWEPYSE